MRWLALTLFIGCRRIALSELKDPVDNYSRSGY